MKNINYDTLFFMFKVLESFRLQNRFKSFRNQLLYKGKVIIFKNK